MQLKIASAFILGGATAHAYSVWSERRRTTPTGRLLQFGPGSFDDRVASSLRTGDLILFSRDCSLYAGTDCLACFARKELAGSPFDQAGVIVLVHGEPHVLELTFSGVKLRRYEARVRASKSKKILIRPLSSRLTKEQERAAVEFSQAMGAVKTSRTPGVESLTEDTASDGRGGFIDLAAGVPFSGSTRELMHMALSGGRYHEAARFVEGFYATLGVGITGVSSGGQGGSEITPFLHPGNPFDGKQGYRPMLWVRDLA